jgi:hypothetical protein
LVVVQTQLSVEAVVEVQTEEAHLPVVMEQLLLEGQEGMEHQAVAVVQGLHLLLHQVLGK